MRTRLAPYKQYKSQLAFWWDTMQFINGMDNTTQSSWVDRLGLTASQATSGLRPTLRTNIVNGKPVLRFGKNGNTADETFFDFTEKTLSTDFCIFIAVNLSNYNRPLGTALSAGNPLTSQVHLGSNTIGPGTFDTAGNFYYGSAIPSLEWQIICYTKNKMFINGVEAALGATGTLTTLKASRLGARTDGTAQAEDKFIFGDVFAVGAFNFTPTTQQRKNVEQYLSNFIGTKYNLIFDGNSNTIGQGTTGGNDYPSQCIALLGAQYEKTNIAVSGQTTAQMISDATTDVDARLNRSYRDNIVIMSEGINDLASNQNVTTTYNNIVTYCQARKAAGFKVIIVPLTPRSNVGVYAGYTADYQAVNALLLDNYESLCHGFCSDLLNEVMFQPGGETNLTYYSGDNVHYNNTGAGVVANSVKNKIKSILGFA